MSLDLKLSQIKEAYQKGNLENPEGYSPANHSFFREDVILQMFEYMMIFRKAFQISGWKANDMPKRQILEIGCGWGLRLTQLLGFNLLPNNLYGIDLLEPYVNEARKNNPGIQFHVMSATDIKFEDKSFDLSFGCVALSSMLDDEVIDASLSEMCRVSRSFVLLIDNFDPSYEDHRNGYLCFKGVSKEHIEKLKFRPDVLSVDKIASFWSASNFAWRVKYILDRLQLDKISYAIVIRLLAPHSHQAYLIELQKKI